MKPWNSSIAASFDVVWNCRIVECDVVDGASLKAHFLKMENDYRHFFEVDPAKRGGKPCFKGTRLTPYDVLSLMAAGIPFGDQFGAD
jgi:hypothetical protein